MRRGEEHAHGPAFRVPEERCPIASDRIHDRSDIVHPLLEVGQPDPAVREARAALVEADQPREGSEPLEEVSVRRVLPVDLEMREEARDEYEVEGAFTGDLVGDVDLAAPRVPDRRDHRASSRNRKQSTVWSFTSPTDCMNA